MAWQELPSVMAQIDVNLAPLELDNPFCQAKSEIKFTEAALVGVPTVASPTQAFAYAIRDGEDGLLAAGADEWRQALTRLIERHDYALQLGEEARRKVYAAYLVEQAAPKLVATLHTIISRHAPPADDPQQLLQVLAQRMLVQLAHSQAEAAQLQRQADQLRSTLAQWDGTGSGQGAGFWRAGMEATQERQQAILREILERLERGGRKC
jgi:hypothetical protein